MWVPHWSPLLLSCPLPAKTGGCLGEVGVHAHHFHEAGRQWALSFSLSLQNDAKESFLHPAQNNLLGLEDDQKAII